MKSAAVSAFRTSYRPGDRSFTNSSPEQEKMSLQSLEIITDALLEIKEVDFINWTDIDRWKVYSFCENIDVKKHVMQQFCVYYRHA